MKTTAKFFAVWVLVFFFVQTGFADIYSGTRSTSVSGQLQSDDAWDTSHGGFQVTYSVTEVTNPSLKAQGYNWQYTYTFRNASGDTSTLSPAITKFLKIEVSNVSGSKFAYISDGSTTGYSAGSVVALAPINDIGFHIWDAPADAPYYDMYHIKIGTTNDTAPELNDNTVTILSSQAPKWGSFYARGTSNAEGTSGPAEALNQGFLTSMSGLKTGVRSDGTTYEYYEYDPSKAPAFSPLNLENPAAKAFILVPDSSTTITPIPAAAWLLGSGLIGLAGLRRLKKRRK
jgi:hypothetical protein